MKKLFERLDPVYTKRAAYAGGAVLITAFLGLLIYSCLPILSKFTKLVGAVLSPLLIGFVIWYLLLPSVTKIEARLTKTFGEKRSFRGLSVLIMFLLICAVLGIFLVVISQPFVSQINFDSIVGIIQGTGTDFQELAQELSSYLDRFNIQIPDLGAIVSGVISSVASGASTFFFGIIFAVYFLIDANRLGSYWSNVAEKLFSAKTISRCKSLLSDADLCFSGYIRGQVTDAILVGAVISIVFSFMKMDYPLIVGLMTGLGNLIPYIGPAMGYISVIMVNLLSGNIQMMVIGLIVLQIIMMIDGNIINPRLLAGTIKVHPLLVVASLLAGGAIGGLLGMLLAVPVGAFVRMQFEKWLAKKEPPEEPAEAEA